MYLFAEKKTDVQDLQDHLRYMEMKSIKASLQDIRSKEERNFKEENLELVKSEEAA